MADEAQRPTGNGHNSEVIHVRDYFEELRRSDQQHWRETIQQLELRLQQRFDAQEKGVNCVSADTPVLCADLVWRSAGELRVGDELIGFDADSPDTGAGRAQSRRFRRSVVTGNSLEQDMLIRVTTERGEVLCNAAHPWLVRQWRGQAWHYVTTKSLKPGDMVMHAIDVWDVDRSWEAGWLAGILDGEGCLCFKNGAGQARLSVVQRESALADKIEATLKERVSTVGVRCRAGTAINSSGHSYVVQPQRNCEVNARPDVMKLLGSVRPSRLLLNADAVWDGWTIGGNNRMIAVRSIQPAGMGTIASLSTSTNTYIAAGYCMHNTAMLAAEKAVNAALLASDKAVEKAEGAQGLRNAQQNEWRGSLEDLSARMWTREEGTAAVDSLRREMAIRVDGLDAKLGALQQRLDKNDGIDNGMRSASSTQRDHREDTRGLIAVAISVIGAAFVIIRALTGH